MSDKITRFTLRLDGPLKLELLKLAGDVPLNAYINGILAEFVAAMK